MKHAYTLLAALLLVAPAQAQTLKSLMFNSTNGQVVANTGTNVLTFTNAVNLNSGISENGVLIWDSQNNEFYAGATFRGELAFGGSNAAIYAATTRTNLGVGAAWLTNTNVTNFRTAIGLGATNSVAFYTVEADSYEARGGLIGINGISFEDDGQNITRTNLGATTIGNAVFTAANATAARQALGLQSYTNTLTNSVNDVEIGSTVSSVTIGWTIAPTDATYAVRTLVGASQTNSITNNSSTLARTGLALTSNTTWTLTVGDGLGVTNTATTAVNFLNYMVYGRSTNTTLSNAAIQTLHTTGGGASRALSTSRARSFTMDGGANYIFIAYPSSFGAATFTVGGLPNTAFTLTTNSYVNPQGFTNTYLIYRTDTIQNGTGINFVVQ